MSEDEVPLTGHQKVQRAYKQLLVPMAQVADVSAVGRSRVEVLHVVNERLWERYGNNVLPCSNPENIVYMHLVNVIRHAVRPTESAPDGFERLVVTGTTYHELESWEWRRNWIQRSFEKDMWLPAALYYAGDITEASRLSSILDHTNQGEANRIISRIRAKDSQYQKFKRRGYAVWRGKVG